MSSVTVDARYLLWPLPVIRTQDHVARLRLGDSVRGLCTDPGVLHDIPSWCRLRGHTVCGITRQGGRNHDRHICGRFLMENSARSINGLRNLKSARNRKGGR